MRYENNPLSERDARALTTKIVERLRALGTLPSQFGVSVTPEGDLWFSARLNQRLVNVRTPPGSFTYDAVARELLALSLDPNDWGSQMHKITPPAPTLVSQ